ncbi:MAG TPA: cholesterol catabolism transcriptional regulator KstR [Pseudonocardia sp.]|nr:cholesterol catabolism transcriptional regulator KstR [Pseudonocardia sp.]
MTAEPRPATTAGTLSALTEEDLGSPAQRDRRKRILDATMALASKGGFDAVQMRAVAERADVALGTLYRYFPSKIHLLVTALIREFGRALERLERTPIPGETQAEGVLYVLSRNTRSLQRDPQLTEAMTRAFMFADTSVAAEVTEVGRLLERMLTAAMGVEEPSEEDKAIARVIGDVWLSNLVAWVTHRASAEDVSNRLELTVRLLLGPREAR